MKKNGYSFLLFIVAVMCVFSCAAAADEPVGVSLFYRSENENLVGATFDLYRIAQKDPEGQWQLCAPFDSYPVQPNENWERLASTLEGYVLRDHPAPSHSGSTNANGFLRLPQQTGDMKYGLYLLVGHPHTQNNKRYTAQPVMLELPYLSTDGSTWRYDVLVNLKSEADETPDDPQTVTRKVLKVWNDQGQEQNRPAEITVDLLKNGAVAETVVLNAQNHWRWTWLNLDARARWHVVERNPQGYSVQVVQEGITFVITNTFEQPEPTPTPTATPVPSPTGSITPTPSPSAGVTPTPSPSAGVTPTPSPTTGVTSTPSPTAGVTPTPAPYVTPTPRPSQPTLPQTGQLWWPVPALVCAGLLFMILGLLRRRSDAYEED